jgi:hypothetical protein
MLRTPSVNKHVAETKSNVVATRLTLRTSSLVALALDSRALLVANIATVLRVLEIVQYDSHSKKNKKPNFRWFKK